MSRQVVARVLVCPSRSANARMAFFNTVCLLLHLGVLLLIGLVVPDYSGVRSEGEQQANDVAEEKQDSSEPGVRSHSFDVEAGLDCWRLREVASSAVIVRGVRSTVRALVAVQLMRAVDLVEQSWAESANDCKQQHRVCSTGTAHVEALCLSLECAEAHTQTRQEEDTGKDGANDTAFNEPSLALMQSNAIEIDFDDGAEEGVDSSANSH